MLHRRNSTILAGILAITSLTAAASPTPTPSPSLNSGTEGAKAALVRIELVAQSEIAHVNSSSGRAEIARGRSEVPLGASTGVLVSADGIIATTWENLALDEGAVAVQSANDLFSNVIRVPIVGNDGNALRRGSTPDQFWAPHLQHCYDLVDHCILFKVPQYRIRTYTSEPGSVWAELINKPSAPHDVALLQIAGGGGAPTAALAPPAAVPGEGNTMLGFVSQPTSADPAELPVKVDMAAGRIGSEHALGALLNAGASGGPVIDKGTGHILGLAGPLQPDGQAVFTPVTAIQAAMADAGVEPSLSRFDVVFRRGIDNLAAGNQGGSAVSALEESLTYYDSKLAADRLEEARATGTHNAGPAAEASSSDSASSFPTALLATLAGIILLGGILAVVASRRRKAAMVSSSHVSNPDGGARHGSGTNMTAPGARAAHPPGDKGQAAGAPPFGSDRQQAHPPGEGRDASASDPTRAAGPFALRAAHQQQSAGGQSQASCPHCGEPVQPGARFCTGCGQPLG
ncbi:zinc ribbon domain-containing protein [Arthrobacter sp. D3-16]